MEAHAQTERGGLGAYRWALATQRWALLRCLGRRSRSRPARLRACRRPALWAAAERQLPATGRLPQPVEHDISPLACTKWNPPQPPACIHPACTPALGHQWMMQPHRKS